MQQKHLVMITVGEYQPLAGSGLNTIRRLSSKYEQLRPGDTVTMYYGILAKEGEEEAIEGSGLAKINGIEQLVVASTVILPYFVLMDVHMIENHGNLSSREEFDDFFRETYNGLEESDRYVAIYFQ